MGRRSVGTTAPEGVRTAFSAIAWNYSGAVAAAVLQVAYTAYTSRVVLPEGFGVYAAAAAALTILGYVAGAGLATYLLRAERLTRQTVRTAYLVALVGGALCCLVTLAIAPWCAVLWGVPEIEPVVRLYALYFLAQPASLVATAALRRVGHARFAALTDTGAQVGGMAVGTVLLASGWDVYGLVLAQNVTPAIALAVAATRLARCPLAEGPRVRVTAMLGVSGAFAGYGMIQMVAADIALWAVTHRFGPHTAGQFSRAMLTVSLPAGLLAQSLRRAVMPSLARVNGERRSLAGALPEVLSAASAIGFVSFGVIAGIGSPAVRLLLGPGWDAAGPLVVAFAVGAPLVLLLQIGYAVDEVGKAMMVLLRVQLLVLAMTAVLVAAAAATGGLLIVAVAGAVAAGIGHAAQLARWSRAGLVHVPSLVRPYAVHAALGAALFAAGAAGSSFGTAPVDRIVGGLLGMVPVAVAALVSRRRIPAYATAVSLGLVSA